MADFDEGVIFNLADAIFAQIQPPETAYIFECMRLNGVDGAMRQFQILQLEAEFDEIFGGQEF